MRSAVIGSVLVVGLMGAAVVCAEEGLRSINGTQIFCRSEGTGKPMVVVHGGPGLGHDYLYPHFRQLASEFRLVFYDQRGSGRSAALGEAGATIDQHVEDLEGVRAAHGIDRMVLTGQSWGAVIALNYALRYPTRVERLLLLEPAPGSQAYLAPVTATINERLGEQGRQALAAIVQSEGFRGRDPETFRRYMTLRMGTYFHDRAKSSRLDFSYFDQDRVRKFFDSSAAMGPYLTSFDLYPRLSAIRCPVLIIHGESDPVPLEAMTRLKEAITSATLEIVKECGHFVHLEKPDAYFPKIVAFAR